MGPQASIGQLRSCSARREYAAPHRGRYRVVAAVSRSWFCAGVIECPVLRRRFVMTSAGDGYGGRLGAADRCDLLCRRIEVSAAPDAPVATGDPFSGLVRGCECDEKKRWVDDRGHCCDGRTIDR